MNLSHRVAARARRVRSRREILRRYEQPLTPWAAWYLLRGRELDNFTYDIENLDELGRFVAEALDVRPEVALAHIVELEHDRPFRRALDERLRKRGRERARFGRRLGWYAVTRILGPRLVVETGVHDGLGSAVFLRALERNAADGRPGSLLSFDIAPGTGWLAQGLTSTPWELCVGDTRSRLPDELATRKLDLFLHDSDHSYDHETFELETALAAAAGGAVLLSDNAHGEPAFRDFCTRHGLACHVFRERPRRHFYPGAGIGLTVAPGSRDGGGRPPGAP